MQLGIAREPNTPVQSSTTSTPSARHGKRDGSRSANREMRSPHQHAVARQLHRIAEATVAGVEAGQVHHGLGGRQLVDGHYLDVLVAAALVEGPQHVAADAPVSVDGNLDHENSVSLAATKGRRDG
jgi:hypothetical protein